MIYLVRCHVHNSLTKNYNDVKCVSEIKYFFYMSNFVKLCIGKGFSLTSWTSERHLQAASLPDYGLIELYEDLGLAMFVQENSCSGSTNFSSLINGWAKGNCVVVNIADIKLLQEKYNICVHLIRFALSMLII